MQGGGVGRVVGKVRAEVRKRFLWDVSSYGYHQAKEWWSMCMMEGGRERGWDGAKRDMGYTCVRSLVFFSVNVTFCLEDVVNVL